MSRLSKWWKRLWAGREGPAGDPSSGRSAAPEEAGRSEGVTGSVESPDRQREPVRAIPAAPRTTGSGETAGAPLATTDRPDFEERPGSDPQEGDVLRPDRLWYARPGDADEAVLIIGFDLGTSTSKVIVHAQSIDARFLAERETDVAHGVPAWLWPSSLSVDDDGVCALGGTSSGSAPRTVKLDLMDVASREEVTASACNKAGAAVAAYLAMVLRAVRSQILVKQRGVFERHATAKWSLNLGVPSGLNEDDRAEDLRIRRLFLRAVAAGWHLSLREEPTRLKDAETAFLRCDEVGAENVVDVGGTEIKAFPEVIAGVVGYDRSDSRRDGLHLAVDVGAATVDVCLFNLPTDIPTDVDEPWPLLEARVKPLGVSVLHGRRVAAVAGTDAVSEKKLERSYDPLNGMADDPGIPGSAPGFGAIDAVDRQVRREIGQLVGDFVQEGRTRRYPNAAAYRSDGAIPTLVMGGGSRAEFYRRALREAGDSFAEKLGERHRGLDVLDAPVPHDVDRQSDGMGYRLAVAVGLSELGLNLPAYRRPGEVGNVVRPAPERRVRPFVGPEQV